MIRLVSENPLEELGFSLDVVKGKRAKNYIPFSYINIYTLNEKKIQLPGVHIYVVIYLETKNKIK